MYITCSAKKWKFHCIFISLYRNKFPKASIVFFSLCLVLRLHFTQMLMDDIVNRQNKEKKDT